MHEAETITDPFRWISQSLDGKHRVDDLVGARGIEGGFGVVYRAHHLGSTPIAMSRRRTQRPR